MDETAYVSVHTNALGEGMNPSVSKVMGKNWNRVCLLAFFRRLVSEMENSRMFPMSSHIP